MDPISVPSPAELAALDGPELDRALVEVERARRQLEAAYLTIVDRADVAKRFTADGHASVRGWVMALTDSSPTETQRRLQTMRALRDLPELANALADGRVGVDHTREIAKLHANPRVRELVTDGDDRLVAHARRGFAHLSQVLARWEQFGDPVGAAKTHRNAHRDRDASVFVRNGTVVVHATCGTAQGALILEAFRRQCDAEFLTDWDHAKAEHGDDVSFADLERTDAQRRMDALAHLVDRAVAAPSDARPPEPLVNITMTLDVAETAIDALAHGRAMPPASLDTVDTMICETDSGLPIDPRDAVGAMLTGRLRRVILDDTGRAIDLGHKRRFTGGARDAVFVAEGRRCLWPGCGRNSNQTQIDHTREHARGGPTRPDNGGPMCGRHNRWKNRGYTVRRDPDGTWHTHRPDGTELTRPNAA